MDDLGAVLDLFNTCSMAQMGKATVEETELRGYWEMPGFDLENDTCVVLAPDGEMVGYADVRGDLLALILVNGPRSAPEDIATRELED